MSGSPFAALVDRYDRWFDRFPAAYESELRAFRRVLCPFTRGIEVGVGTGRFAAPLGFRVGVDPVLPPLRRARERGILGVMARGEALPLRSGSVDAVLVVTTLCFVEDWEEVLREIRRVLVEGGRLYVGVVDGESFLGRRYREARSHNPFYREAVFWSIPEVQASLSRHEFQVERVVQTLFQFPEAVKRPEPVRAGWGQGGFVVLRSRKGDKPGGEPS